MRSRTAPAPWLIPAALLLFAAALRWVPGPRTIDDAYITFRYVRNILAGNGFVYNPGEPVLGTTTPLYTFLLTVLGLFSGGPQAPFPEIALVVNSLADGVTCILLFLLGRRLGSTAAGLGAALAWVVAPYSVTFAIGGLETSVFVLLLTAAALAHLSTRTTLAALLGALAVLTRPDSLLLVAPLAADRLLQIGCAHPRLAGLRRQLGRFSGLLCRLADADDAAPFHWKEAAAFLLPAGAWLVFATVTFGSPIPHSVSAKNLAYHLPENSALVRLVQHYATPFMENLTFGVPAIAAGLVLYPFLYILGARKALQSSRRVWPLALFPWLYFAAYAIANPLIFRWYLTPILPAYFLFILTGAEGLLRAVLSRLEGQRLQRTLQPAGAAALVLVPALLLSGGWTLAPDHGLTRPAPEMAWYKIELAYRQAADRVAQEIRQRGQDMPVLAAGDVGVLGYYTPARILDTVGLNSPVTLQYLPVEQDIIAGGYGYAVPPDLILEQHPDYVVLMEVYIREGLLKDPRFAQSYELLETIPTDYYDSEGMLIFARR